MMSGYQAKVLAACTGELENDCVVSDACGIGVDPRSARRARQQLAPHDPIIHDQVELLAYRSLGTRIVHLFYQVEMGCAVRKLRYRVVVVTCVYSLGTWHLFS